MSLAEHLMSARGADDVEKLVNEGNDLTWSLGHIKSKISACHEEFGEFFKKMKDKYGVDFAGAMVMTHAAGCAEAMVDFAAEKIVDTMARSEKAGNN